MIFQKMNNVLIKHGKTISVIILFIIIVAFVWYFTPGVDGSILFGRRVGGGATYGTALNGVKITYSDVSAAISDMSLINGAQYGMAPGRISSVSEDNGFQIAAMLKIADKLHIQASEQDVADFIKSNFPVFSNDGKFDATLYTTYEKKCLTPYGLSLADLEKAVAKLLRIEKLSSFLGETSVVTDSEIRQEVARMMEKTHYRLITFPSANYESEIKITDDEVQQFYNLNLGLFMTEPQSDGVLAVALPENKEKISDEQISDYYELVKDTLVDAEGKKQTLDEAKDYIRKNLEEQAGMDVAKEKIQKFNKEFREYARLNKDEYATTAETQFRKIADANGLKLVPITNLTPSTVANLTEYVDTGVITSATSLKNVNSYTNIQTGDKCCSMFLLTARRPSEQAAFADVKDKATAQVKSKKMTALSMEYASKFLNAASASKDLGKDLEKLVKDVKGTLADSDTFSIMSARENQLLLYTLPVTEILETEVGKLSAQDDSMGTPRFVYIESKEAASKEDIEKQMKESEDSILSAKRNLVNQSIQKWLVSTIFVNRPSERRETPDEIPAE